MGGGTGTSLVLVLYCTRVVRPDWAPWTEDWKMPFDVSKPKGTTASPSTYLDMSLSSLPLCE